MRNEETERGRERTHRHAAVGLLASERFGNRRHHVIPAEVAKRSRDLWIEKTLPGSFTNTVLESWLRERGLNTVTIAGYMTHMCCDTTAREAVHRGFTVEFLRDATGTLALDNAAGQVTAEELQRSILCAQQMMLSEVLSVRDWTMRL